MLSALIFNMLGSEGRVGAPNFPPRYLDDFDGIRMGFKYNDFHLFFFIQVLEVGFVFIGYFENGRKHLGIWSKSTTFSQAK